MPIRTSKRNVGKEKKKVSDVSNATSVIDGNISSSQNISKDWPGDPNDSNNSTMKSITSRSSNSKPLDPDSSSLGAVESAKEAKEKDKHRSWKTIGIKDHLTSTLRLRLRKADKSKSHIPVDEIFPNNASTAGTATVVCDTAPTETPVASSSLPSGEQVIAGEHVKLKKSSRFGASSNGSVLRDKILSSASSSNTTTGKTKEATGTDTTTIADKQDPARFAGDGMSFKAKLIGVLEVSGPRGDRICQEALSELKMAVKAAGEHKQKITVHIALDGLRIRDEKTGDCLYHHQVHKISFIAQDLTDARAFGYIFGSPDMGHRYNGIKTEKSANQVVIAMRDLFQVVFDLKKKEIERAKQQLEMQQKFLATRAAEKKSVDHRSSSQIAETYIEGACALGTPSSPRTASAPEVDLLNLEVELNSLQDCLEGSRNFQIENSMDNKGLDHNNSEIVPFRGSTASISSDPMNHMQKFSSVTSNNSSQGGTANSTNFVSTTGDQFADSFDPFYSSSGTVGTFQQKHFQYSQSSPIDPFEQIDPFPKTNFSNLENSDSFFNSDPFETPVGNFSFNFTSGGPSGDLASGTSSSGFVSSESTIAAASINPTNNHHHNNSRSSNNSFAGESADVSGSNWQWQASFEDNFVPDALTSNGPSADGEKADIFTELDPLGTGRVRPFVDRKDFFQELKNPPKKILKDLYHHSSTESGTAGGQQDDSPTPQPQQSGSGTSKVDRANTKNAANIVVDSMPNSFSTNFNPSLGFDSKTTALTSNMGRKFAERNGRETRSTALYRSSHDARSVSPPHYSPPPPPPSSTSETSNTTNYPSSFSNNEYFAAGSSTVPVDSVTSVVVSSSSMPPLLLPPPSSTASLIGSGSSPSFNSRNTTTKKSPQLLKQMTIASSGITHHSSSSPKSLPRSTRLGKQFTVDSSDEHSPIPNLTPPPRGVTLGKTMTLSTAVPRPYSAGSDKSMGGLRSSSGSGTLQHFHSSISSNNGPEPPPRPLQTTMITSTGAINMTTNNSLSLDSSTTGGPPLPPKKRGQMSVPLSTPPVMSGKHLYTSESRKKDMSGKSSMDSNDLPLPLPLRKAQIGIQNGGQMSGNSFNLSSYNSTSGNRYCVPPPSSKSVSSRAPDFVIENIPPRPDHHGIHRQKHAEIEKSSLTMEQALYQVASMSLGQLATRLELPVEKLANFTVQQLAEKLTTMDLDSERDDDMQSHNRISSSRGHDDPTCNSKFGSHCGGSARELNQSVKTNVEGHGFVGFDDDFSTASAPAVSGFHHSNKSSNNHSNRNNNNSASNNNSGGNSFDKYAVFRELDVELASGFSLGPTSIGRSSKEDNSKESDDDDQSKTLDLEKSVMSRDSSSERTLQVDGSGYPIANTMDDVTDGNLSDNDDKFPLDDDSPLASHNSGQLGDWATFESNFEDSKKGFFEDSFAPLSGRTPLKLQSVQKKPESPWDSDDENYEGSKSMDKIGASSMIDGKPKPQSFLLDDGDKNTGDFVLPPDPDEFNFQPFEKPSPIVTAIVPDSSRDMSSIRRASRDKDRERDRQVFELFELEPRSPIIGGGSSNFTRQGSGKNSDYSDSGRHTQVASSQGGVRSRTSSRDYEKSERGDRWPTEPCATRPRDRDRDYSRPDSRNSYTSTGRPERKFRESDDDFVPFKYSAGNSRDNSLRRSGGRPRGHRERDRDIGGSSKNRGESFDNEDEDEEDDDRSYVSYHSNSYSQGGSSRRRRRYKPSHHHSQSLHGGSTSGGNPKKRRGSGSKDISPEPSNQESDYDDSYDEDNGSSNGGVISGGNSSMRRGDYYSREYQNYGKPTSNHSQLKYGSRGRPNSGSGSSRYSNRDSPRDRDYYSHHHGKSYRTPRPGSPGERERYSHRRMHYNEHSDEDDDGKVKREYSDDYSCEESQVSRGSRRQKGRRPAGSRVERERERERENRKGPLPRGDRDGRSHYHTNSPSMDSESPDRDCQSGGDRRKIRWGSNRDRGHHRQSVEHLDKSPSKSPSPLTVGSSRGGSGRHSDRMARNSTSNKTTATKLSEYGFDDNFSKVTTRQNPPDDIIMVSGKSFADSFQGDSIASLPPQSPFEDNFVVNCQLNSMDIQLNSIEFKRGEDDQDPDNCGGDFISGDVFFPAKFDVDLEIEKESRRFNDATIVSLQTIPSSASPSSAEMTRSSPRLESILNSSSKRLESIRSEEERLQSSDDGADLSTDNVPINENNVKENCITMDKHVSDNDKENEGDDVKSSGMKKSESFTIFKQEKDPFEDEFFQNFDDEFAK